MTPAIAHGPGPLQELHLGTVLENADPQVRGRVRVRLHATGLEAWAAVMVPSAGSGYGVSLLPRVGEVVVLGFVSPDLPIVMGALWTGSAPAPDEAAPAEQRYLLRTPAGLQVLLDDEGPGVDIRTPAGNRLTLTDAFGGQATLELAGETLVIEPGRVTVRSSGRVEVQAAQVGVTAAAVQVDAALSRFSGVVQCDTMIAQTVVASAYTPGAGNLW